MVYFTAMLCILSGGGINALELHCFPETSIVATIEVLDFVLMKWKMFAVKKTMKLIKL